MNKIGRLLENKVKDFLNGWPDEKVKDILNGRPDDKSCYHLACQAISNDFGTCYISVAIQLILAMQATREAFLSLPDRVPGDIFGEIPYRLSMTTLIRFFFLQRRRPNEMSREELQEYSQNDWHPAANVINWLHERFPESFSSLGNGNSPTNALRFILQTIIEEGYVKGLAEDLTGKYTIRTTCKACGVTYDFLHETIMLIFSDENSDLPGFLKSHAGDVQMKTQGRNNITGSYLTLGNLFSFAEVMRNESHEHMFCHSKSSGCDISHRTTIRQLPRTLILGINCVYFEENSGMYEEFLNLSENMESECSSSTKYRNYKLVAVIKEVINGGHVIAYVRASKYGKQTGNIESENNRWLRMDDEVIKLVNLEEMFNVKPREQLHLLIYEQLEE